MLEMELRVPAFHCTSTFIKLIGNKAKNSKTDVYDY